MVDPAVFECEIIRLVEEDEAALVIGVGLLLLLPPWATALIRSGSATS